MEKKITSVPQVTTDFLKNRRSSVKFAFEGIVYVLKTQKNAWIHLFISVIVLIVSAWLKLSPWEWVGIILSIALVWMAEFLNTSLEIIVDLASPEKHPLAKVGKDVGAGAVLISAFFSAIVGFIILCPKIIELLGY